MAIGGKIVLTNECAGTGQLIGKLLEGGGYNPPKPPKPDSEGG
jgi:hypothetical protein